MKQVTMTKRFYVSSDKMTNGTADRMGWMRLYPEAVEEAKARLKRNPNLEKCFIVEVIAVVERENPPFVVSRIRK
jgi:hypothetical protein